MIHIWHDKETFRVLCVRRCICGSKLQTNTAQNVCMCICTYIYVCVYICIYVYMGMRCQILRKSRHVCIYIHTRTCTQALLSAEEYRRSLEVKLREAQRRSEWMRETEQQIHDNERQRVEYLQEVCVRVRVRLACARVCCCAFVRLHLTFSLCLFMHSCFLQNPHRSF
jgi:hypothetical protein